MMIAPDIVAIVAGVSSLCGLLSLLAFWFFLQQVRLAERSLREIVEGEGLFSTTQVASILSAFRDDDARLAALKALAGHDARRAEVLYGKVKDHVDLGTFDRRALKDRRQRLLFSAVFFLLFGVGAFIYYLAAAAHGTGAAPGPTPRSATPPSAPTDGGSAHQVDCIPIVGSA